MSKPVVHYFFLHALAEFVADRSRCNVLDIGSGTGYLTVALARVLEDASVDGAVLGIEVTDALAGLGTANFAKDDQSAPLAARVAFRREDACAPHRSGESFDFILASAAARGSVP